MLLTLQDDNHPLNQLGHSCLQIIERKPEPNNHTLPLKMKLNFLAHVFIKQSIL